VRPDLRMLMITMFDDNVVSALNGGAGGRVLATR
jgi:hypothetical protein